MMQAARPKTRRARRFLEARAPKLHESAKKAVLLQGSKVSSVLKEVLSDIHHLKHWGGCSTKLSRKNNNIRPFEAGGETSLEFLSQKTDCSLFMFASHSKKRPHNLVIGRTFDHHIYDMVEVGVERVKTIKDLKGGGKYAPQVGSKPCFTFIGDEFESNPVLGQLKSILLDFFRGEVVESINLAGLDRVFVCIAHQGKVFLRHCAVRLKRSGTKVPRVDLVEVGPALDLVVRRSREPGEDLRKAAMKSAASLEKKAKNVQSSEVGGKTGRIYMPKQEVGTMALKKMKGLKRERREAAAARKGRTLKGKPLESADSPAPAPKEPKAKQRKPVEDEV